VNGLTNESESALPLDNSFWEHVSHLNFTIGIPVSETKTMDILTVLEDIYRVIDRNPEEAQRLIVMVAAILVAAKDGQADEIWEELVVSESMTELDESLKEILNEKN
jgi:hypothetical protein